MRKDLWIGILLLCLLVIPGIVAGEERTITDMSGEQVTLPSTVHTAGTSWPGFTDVLLAIGGYPKIVAISEAEKSYPWALRIFPDLNDPHKMSFSTSGVNMEQLIANKPDVLFLRSGDPVDTIKGAGIPGVMINNTQSIRTMAASALLAGKVLGTDEEKSAEKYSAYVNQTLDAVTAKTKNIPETEKPKVLYASSKSGKVSVWGRDLLQDEMIHNAGGINVAADDVKGSQVVSSEMLLKWMPDIVITDSIQSYNELNGNQGINSTIPAFRSGKVFVAPAGVFYWTNMGAECVLQLPWLAQKLHPNLFGDINMVEKTQEFYQTFFGYQLSDEDANKILAGEPPT